MVDELTDDQLGEWSRAIVTEENHVNQRFYTQGRGNVVKETDGLKTCIRVAVSGDYNHPNALGYDRFLAHVDALELEPLEGFIDKIRLAKRRGIRNLRAVIVAPEPEDASEDDGGDDLALQNEIQEKLEAVVDQANITVVTHPANETWYLIIQADKTFDYGKDFSDSESGDGFGDDSGEESDEETGDEGEISSDEEA